MRVEYSIAVGMCTDAKRRLSLPASLDMEEADGEVAVGTWQASARARRSLEQQGARVLQPYLCTVCLS